MALRYEGWESRRPRTVSRRSRIARQFRPDVIVLDVMLPDMDGLSVLHRLRADGNDTPVLFLTAKDAVDDRIAGLTRRRRRLRHQAVQPRGGGGPAARAHPPHSRIVSDAVDPELRVGDLVLNEESYEVQPRRRADRR